MQSEVFNVRFEINSPDLFILKTTLLEFVTDNNEETPFSIGNIKFGYSSIAMTICLSP